MVVAGFEWVDQLGYAQVLGQTAEPVQTEDGPGVTVGVRVVIVVVGTGVRVGVGVGVGVDGFGVEVV